jgi:hypothetical protein
MEPGFERMNRPEVALASPPGSAFRLMLLGIVAYLNSHQWSLSSKPACWLLAAGLRGRAHNPNGRRTRKPDPRPVGPGPVLGAFAPGREVTSLPHYWSSTGSRLGWRAEPAQAARFARFWGAGVAHWQASWVAGVMAHSSWPLGRVCCDSEPHRSTH